MRLTYLSEAAIPSRSSNATQTMRMCAAFSAVGADVTLVHPALDRAEPEGFNGDIDDFYGVRDGFERRVLRASRVDGGKTVQRVTRSVPFLTYLAHRSRPGTPPFVCYARSLPAAWMAVRVRRAWGRRSSCRAVVVEVHDEPPSQGWPLLAAVDGAVAISDALRRRLVRGLPALEDHIWVEHDGADLGAVNRDLDRDAARARIGHVALNGPLVVYAGRVIAGKGVDVLIDAARHLERIGGRVLVVGRVYEDDYCARATPNVTFTGFVAPSEVPHYLAAADVMVMPTTEDLAYAAYTSPLKLFEYMATGNPVVASDLPVLREILSDGQNALLYPSGDAPALAQAVERLWSQPALAAALAEQAWADVQYYDWRARAGRILDRLQRLTTAQPISQAAGG